MPATAAQRHPCAAVGSNIDAEDKRRLLLTGVVAALGITCVRHAPSALLSPHALPTPLPWPLVRSMTSRIRPRRSLHNFPEGIVVYNAGLHGVCEGEVPEGLWEFMTKCMGRGLAISSAIALHNIPGALQRAAVSWMLPPCSLRCGGPCAEGMAVAAPILASTGRCVRDAGRRRFSSSSSLTPLRVPRPTQQVAGHEVVLALQPVRAAGGGAVWRPV